MARQSDYPGVYPYKGPEGKVLYYCRYPRSDGTWTTKRGFPSQRAANSFRTTAINDAKRGEVFTLVDGDARVVRPDELDAEGKTLVGDGAVRYRDVLTPAEVPPDADERHVPRARFHARLATGYGPAEAVEPLYLRVPDVDR